MSFEWRLGDDPMGIRTVRAKLREWLAGIPCRDGCQSDVELVVSELVTNALTHGHSAPEIRATLDGDRLHIEVHDDDRTPPVMQVPKGSRGGFGLHLVDAVAIRWGWDRTQAGKVVWADVAL